jgi:hypothetical protein
MLLFGGLLGRLFRRLLDAVLAVESFDSARGIDQALRASVKRMAFRANFDVQFLERRASFESVAARAYDFAATVLGMNSRFHFSVSSPSIGLEYHRRLYGTINRWLRGLVPIASVKLTAAIAAGIAILITICASAIAGPASPGFSPPTQTLFAPVVQFASPGPARGARAVAIFDRQLSFQKRFSFHPELSSNLQKVVDLMPPRQSTLIRAAALYSNSDVPWTTLPDGTHQICVGGHPRDRDFLYTALKNYQSPEAPGSFSGLFALKPIDGASVPSHAGVLTALGGEMLMDTYGLPGLVDAFAAALRECYGDLKPPWNVAPGAYDQHDKAAMDRFHAQMPHLATKFDEYLKFNNLVDEFNTPAGIVVLFNADVEVRMPALRKFPHLYEFYRKVIPAVTEKSDICDPHDNYWLHTGFDRGHVRLSFMIRNGLLTPYNSSLKPAGEGVALDALRRGGYRTESSVLIKSMKMNFGLNHISFDTDYKRDAEQVNFESRMTSAPELVAPPGIHKLMDLIAGQFLQALATGHGGLTSKLSSQRLQNGAYLYAGGFSAQCNYSPALEMLARVGDAIAQQHNEAVRKEERAFVEELFDAFVADYNNARPSIRALDTVESKRRSK